MRINSKLAIAICTLITLLALPLIAIGKPIVKAQHSDPDAVEAVQAVYDTVFALREFNADINLVIQNEDFLKGFFDNEEGVSNVGIKGLVHYTDQKGCELLLRRSSTDYNCFVIGNTTKYTGLRTIKRKSANNFSIVEATPEPTVFPSDSASPEPTPEVTPSPSPSPTSAFEIPDVMGQLNVENFMRLLTPNRTSAPRDFPLSFILPYHLSTKLNSSVYTIAKEEAFVYNTRCLQINATNPRSKYKTTLWIDKAHKTILQVMRTNEDSSVKIIATYIGQYPADKETGFAPYQRVELAINGIPIYFAEFTNPLVNPNKSIIESEKVTSKATARARTGNIIQEDILPFLSAQKIKLIVILTIALLVFGLRYAMFAAARQEFADELMIIDEPRGRFSEALDKLGYKLKPFSLEALSAERFTLGKGITKDTTNRPRAIIVAPMALEEVHNHAFLLRAYIEEGGRVLVMRHPKQKEMHFPYKANMVPIPNVGIGVECDLNVLTGLREEEIRRLVATYVTNEAYLKVNDTVFNKSLITLTNKLTDLQATTVGTVKIRKGEYMVCQMQINGQNLTKDAGLQLLFNAIIRYLLGLDPLPYDERNE